MSTATATNPMGLKRICTSCGIRFYDLNKRPIICPSCETEFTGEVKVKSRRGRASAIVKDDAPVKAVAAKEDDDEEILEEDDGVEVVSLDDADEKSSDEDDDPASKLSDDDDDLDDIPDLDDDLDDDLADDDDTLLEEDED